MPGWGDALNTAQLDISLRDFLDSLFAAVEPALDGDGARRVFSGTREACADVSVREERKGVRVPVCSWFDEAAGRPGAPDDRLHGVTEGLKAIEPHLSWFCREDGTGTGSANFPDGHGNALIVGPGGMAEHANVYVGASLLAPDVRYPDHTHPPEELYLVLSDGAFRNAETEWRRPGAGGLFHNPPGIVHAMRSGDGPLLAIWMLVPAA